MLIPRLLDKIRQCNPEVAKIGGSAFWLLLEKLLRMPIGVLVSALVARYLGPSDFGFLSYVLALASILSILSTLGLQDVSIKSLARGFQNEKGEILGTVFYLQLIASVSNTILWIIISFYIYRKDVFLLCVCVAIGVSSLMRVREVVTYYFESEVNAKILVRIGLLVFGISTIIKLCLVFSEAPLLYFGIAYLVDWAIGNLFSLYYFRKYSKGIKLRFNLARAKGFLKTGWILILSALSISLAMRIDQVMLQSILGGLSVGLYSASVRVAEPLLILGGVLLTSAYPMLMNCSDRAFEARFKLVFRIGFYVNLIMVLIVSIFSSTIIHLIYGPSFAGASDSLRVLVFTIPVTFISMMGSKYLLRHDAYRSILGRQVIGLIINVLLNLYLIPRLGILGAALATVLTDVSIALVVDVFSARGRHLSVLKLKSIFLIK